MEWWALKQTFMAVINRQRAKMNTDVVGENLVFLCCSPWLDFLLFSLYAVLFAWSKIKASPIIVY